MKEYPELFRYTMYFDDLTNNIIFLEAWDNNEITYYDEFPDYYFLKSQIGYTLIDYIYLPFDKINKIIDDIITKIDQHDFESVQYALNILYDFHPYYGFYLLKFHQFIEPDDFDEYDCLNLLLIIQKDIKSSMRYCENVIKPLLNLCIDSSLSYEEIYYLYIEKNRLNRYFRNRELLDYNLYYKTTFESIEAYNSKPIDEYSFYKLCFREHLENNIQTIDQKYNEAALKFHSKEDIINEYELPFQTIEDEKLAIQGILPKKIFLQNYFVSYIDHNRNKLSEKFSSFISKQNLQFVESITEDEGIEISIINCLIFELIHMLKSHCKIKVCQNCQKPFPIFGDYNVKYCERTTNHLSCKVIANRKATQAKIQDIPSMKLYMKYYKRYKGRVRIGKITENDFSIWNNSAKKLRDQCINGDISIDVFQNWLDNYDNIH